MMEAYLEQSRRWVPGRASRVRAVQGRVWVTRDGEWDDHLLLPGQVMDLPAGRAVTVGPWEADEAVRLQVCAVDAASWGAGGAAWLVQRCLLAVARGAQAVAQWAQAASRSRGPWGDLGC
jgi:hypothetical protein